MKVIATRYNGYYFRSRTEARWAVFLDAANEDYDYEPDGYNLRSGCYLPDFWLPRLKLFLEIKGVAPTREEEKLCEELAWHTSHPVMVAVRPPTIDRWQLSLYCCATNGSGGSQWFAEQDECCWAFPDSSRKLELCINSGKEFYDFNWRPFECVNTSLPKTYSEEFLELWRYAAQRSVEQFCNEAKSARFEFEDKQ